MNTPRMLFLLAVATALLTAAACGDDEEPATTETEESATPERAVSEIAAVRQGLQEGLAAYREGDAAQADTLIGDAYLEHFELVEGPLEEADPELNEELEVLISTTIRDSIKANAPPAEVQKLVGEAQAGLDRAEQALRAG